MVDQLQGFGKPTIVFVGLICQSPTAMVIVLPSISKCDIGHCAKL